MADTITTLTALQALFATTGTRSISAQDLRDFLYSTLGVIPYRAVTANYTATENDQFIAVDATSAPVTITLPPVATTRVGKVLPVKKTDVSANAVTLDGNASETIDGATTYALSAQWDTVTVVNTGTQWLIESVVT